jgi:hypothetical protein
MAPPWDFAPRVGPSWRWISQAVSVAAGLGVLALLAGSAIELLDALNVRSARSAVNRGFRTFVAGSEGGWEVSTPLVRKLWRSDHLVKRRVAQGQACGERCTALWPGGPPGELRLARAGIQLPMRLLAVVGNASVGGASELPPGGGGSARILRQSYCLPGRYPVQRRRRRVASDSH